MAKKTGKSNATQKTNTMNVNVNVKMESFNDLDFDGILQTVETAQKENGIYAQFGPEPAVLAVTGAAFQQRIYKGATDMVLHLKVVFRDAPNMVKIMTLRGFYQKDESGRLITKGVAYQEAVKLLKAAGVKMSKIHNVDENPNLKEFAGWAGVNEPIVIVVTTRETGGRFWPNRISKYVKIEVSAEDLIADVMSMPEHKEGDAQ